MTFPKKALIISGITLAGAGLIAPVLAQATINGAGASFPAPFYQRAFAGAKGVKVNYQSVGSGAGVRQFVAGSVDFGATDEPIKRDEAAKVSRGVIQFPSVGGTIAIAFNKADCTSLK
ncbi:MAG: substrate-binding domain-containing protein, partial [Cyanobium sp.]